MATSCFPDALLHLCTCVYLHVSDLRAWHGMLPVIHTGQVCSVTVYVSRQPRATRNTAVNLRLLVLVQLVKALAEPLLHIRWQPTRFNFFFRFKQ